MLVVHKGQTIILVMLMVYLYNCKANIVGSKYYLIFQISACDCDTQGSNGYSCDANGICSCKANILGSKCNSCVGGRFNFPTCQGNHYLIQQLIPN